LFDDDICSIISVLVHVSCGTNTALNDINGQSFRIVPMWWSFQVLCRLPNTTKCHNFHFLGRVPEKRNTEITGAGFYRLYVISVIKLTVSKHWIYYSLKHVKSTLNLLLPQQMVLEYLHSPDSWTILSHFLLQNNTQYIREALNDKKVKVKGKLSIAVRHTSQLWELTCHSQMRPQCNLPSGRDDIPQRWHSRIISAEAGTRLSDLW